MKKWRVLADFRGATVVIVEAEDKEQACDIAYARADEILKCVKVEMEVVGSDEVWKSDLEANLLTLKYEAKE